VEGFGNVVVKTTAGTVTLEPPGGSSYIQGVTIAPTAAKTDTFQGSTFFNIEGTYSPTLNPTLTANPSSIRIGTIINIGGTYDEPMNGIYIDPVLTSVPNGYRGIYYKPTTHTFLWQPSGDTVRSYIRGKLGIGPSVSSPKFRLDVGGTDGIRIPVGTTAQRPTGYAGAMRYNTDSTGIEFYNGSQWRRLASGSYGGGSSTDLTFSGSGPVTLNSSSGSDVTFTAGTNITLTRSGNDLSIAATGGASDGNGIYTGDGSIPNGGTDVDLTNGQLRLQMKTTGTTITGLEVIGNTATTTNRFLSMRTEADSMRFQEAGGEYSLIATKNFNQTYSDWLKFSADSIQLVESTAASKTDNISYLLGTTSTGWIKRFSGTANGQVAKWNNTSSRWDISDVSDVILTAAPSTDATATGIKVQLTANENQGFGDVCYVNSSGKAQLGDADGIATAKITLMCLGTVTANNTGTYLVQGVARNDAWNWTVGGYVYLSTTGTTTNTLTQTAPSGTDDCVVVVGMATHADRILFNPSQTIVEIK